MVLPPCSWTFSLQKKRKSIIRPGSIDSTLHYYQRDLFNAIDWVVANNPDTKGLTIGLFGASTGAAAALVAAAQRPNVISAVVSRGGRPDLAGKEIWNKVQAPTLLLVGGGNDDPQVLKLNENTLRG